METFHFAKPSPAYFAEVLAQLGWPEGPAIVVGDDPKNDIEPARSLGLPTYQIRNNGELRGGPTAADGSGDLADFLPWLDQVGPDPTTETSATPAGLLGVLASTPAALDTLITRADPVSINWKPGPTEWSVAEVLCHLRDVEAEVQLPRLQKITHEDNPFLPAENTDAWAAVRGYAAQDGQEALADFMSSRASTIELLKTLGDDAWDRGARHAIFGPTSLKELVVFMAEHDRLHLRQIHKINEASAAG